MSDVNPTPQEPKESDAASGGSSPWFMIRMVVLLLIFGLALVGLLYDYCIARPGLKEADELVKGLLDGTVEDPNKDNLVTDIEVQSLLGKEPSDTQVLGNAKKEVYRWISGLPTRKYELWCSYTGGANLPDGGKLWLLHAAATKEDELDMPETTQPVKEMTPEELDNFVPKTPSGAGTLPGKGDGGGRGGEGEGGGRKGMGKSRPKGPEQPDDVPETKEPAVKEGGTEAPEITEAPKAAEAETKAAEEPAKESPDTGETSKLAPKIISETIDAPDSGTEVPAGVPATDTPESKTPRSAVPYKPGVTKEPALKEKAVPETKPTITPPTPKPAEPETTEEKETPVKEIPTKEDPTKTPAKKEAPGKTGP